jgi:hypothetical protein
MTMPTASIREYAFELVKASFHKLLTSSLSVIASDTALLLYNKYTLSTVSKF